MAQSDRGLEQRTRTDLARIARSVLEQTQTNGFQLRLDLAPSPLLGDPVLLERAVANLLENAVRYNVPGGRISIRTGSDGELSWIRVANSATPDLKGDPDELFLPFRRSGSARGHQGFGLGLSIVRSVALAHGGSAAIEVENGQFHVRMRLPRDGR